jgi:peptidylprolyl isomerase
MQPGLILYHFDACPYCRRVRRALADLGVEVEMRDVQRDAEAHAALVAARGRGSVPVLYIEDTDTVKVHYTGWTTDGEMFDSSVSRGEPATFPLNAVIPGWTEGLQLMSVGAQHRLWIPEPLAYKGAPGRPAGMLVFDVELIAIE